MSTLTKEGKMEKNKKDQDILNPSLYRCELLLEKTTFDKAKDSSFPTDAYLIWYKVENEIHMDLCRCNRRSDLFDLYYDRYGPGSVQKIDFGYGKVSSKLWGYKKPEGKKKR